MTPELTTRAEWARIQKDLTNIIRNPHSRKQHVLDSLCCLCAIADKRLTPSPFPEVIGLVRERHPDVARNIAFIIPDRFLRTELALAEII
jgi:hypothetical protein